MRTIKESTFRLINSRFEIILLCSSLIPVVLISMSLGPITAMKAGFIIIASAVLYLLSKLSINTSPPLSGEQLIKLNVAILSILLALIMQFDVGMVVIVSFSLTISLIVAVHLLGDPSRSGILIQGLLLVSILLLITVVRSGMIIGNIDPIWQHYPNVRNLINSKNIQHLSSRYQRFPILFLLASTLGIISDTGPYGAIEFTISGIGLFYILAGHFFARSLINHPSSKYYPLILPSIKVIAFHIPIFFPQTLAVVLTLLVLGISMRRNSPALQGLGFVIGVALILTHHLTIVIFMPVIVCLYLFYKRTRGISVPIFLSALAYWAYVQENFIISLFTSIQALLITFQSTSTGGITSSTVLLGFARKEETVTQAAGYLLSLRGIYFTVLAILVLSGLYLIFRNQDKFGLGMTGVITGLLVFPLPFSILGLLRTAFSMSFFFIPIVCLGVYNLVKGDRHSNIGVVLTVTLLCSLGPVLAIGYTPIYDGGASHDSQYQISEESKNKLAELAEFSKRTNSEYRTMRTTSYIINFFGGDANQEVEFLDGELAKSDQLFLYRMSWKNQRTSVKRGVGSNQGPTFTNYLFSRQYLSRTVTHSNKVYSSGGTGLISIRD